MQRENLAFPGGIGMGWKAAVLESRIAGMGENDNDGCRDDCG